MDIDAADAAVAPGVSAVGVGGLSSREMLDVVRTVSAEPKLLGADLMELSPPHDENARPSKLAAADTTTANGGHERRPVNYC